jgi:hypothetical protein
MRLGHDTPMKHIETVWKRVIIPVIPTKDILVVAHSYGGVCFCDVLLSALGKEACNVG